jgi:helix-turn-helix protein
MLHAQHTQAIPPAPVTDLLDEFDLLAIFKKRNIRTIRRWIAEGRLPAHLKLGRKRYWRRAALIDFIARNETSSGRVAPRRTRRSR